MGFGLFTVLQVFWASAFFGLFNSHFSKMQLIICWALAF
jgi:hypothetical protein